MQALPNRWGDCESRLIAHSNHNAITAQVCNALIVVDNISVGLFRSSSLTERPHEHFGHHRPPLKSISDKVALLTASQICAHHVEYQ